MPRQRAHLALATCAAVWTMFGVQGVSAALPAVQDALGFSDSGLGLFTAAYMLPGVLMAIPLGLHAGWLGSFSAHWESEVQALQV